IGYAKTGTNWLQRHWWGNPATGYGWLGKQGRDHPVRRLVLDRPLEFDAADVRRRIAPLVEAVEERGLLPVLSLERLAGHAFSGGHDSRQNADRIAEVYPDARVVVAVREQRSMIV